MNGNEWQYVQGLVESQACTGSCVFAMKDEDSCGCRCKGQYHGIALKAIQSRSGDDLLAGQFFHSMVELDCGCRMPEHQGVVVGRVEQGTYLVHFFSWLTGEATMGGLFPLSEMRMWNLYPDAEYMKFEWEYNGLSQRYDRHKQGVCAGER